jgi:ABC-2 type transport system permease protein
MRWVGLKTLIRRECGVVLRFWSFTLAPSIVITILLFVVFGEVIGQRIGSFDGFDYVQYIAPGLIISWVITHAYGQTAGGVLGARIFRFLEEILISPLPGWIVMIGYVISGVVRGVLVGAVVAIVVLLFTHLHIHSVAVTAATVLLAALISALGGFIAALLAKDFDQVYGIEGLVLTPLIYVGGVFGSVSALPHWARTLSLANPMFYIVNGFRYGVLGVSDVPVGVAIALMSIAGIVLCFTAIVLMGRGTALRN